MKISRFVSKLTVLRRQIAYSRAFATPYGEQVLADLMRFCRAEESAFHPDPQVMAHLEGRREVWLRIRRFLRLSDDELWAAYTREKETLIQEGSEQ